jgi:hypothetical protein
MVWVLLLALLLPLAQTAASLHLLSHVKFEQTSAQSNHSTLVVDHCNLDLNAAVLATGAPLVQSSAIALNVLPSAVGIPLVPVTVFAIRNFIYESRAPPSLLV